MAVCSANNAETSETMRGASVVIEAVSMWRGMIQTVSMWRGLMNDTAHLSDASAPLLMKVTALLFGAIAQSFIRIQHCHLVLLLSH